MAGWVLLVAVCLGVGCCYRKSESYFLLLHYLETKVQPTVQPRAVAVLAALDTRLQAGKDLDRRPVGRPEQSVRPAQPLAGCTGSTERKRPER